METVLQIHLSNTNHMIRYSNSLSSRPTIMKNQNEFLPKSLSELPALDGFQFPTDPTDGGGGKVVPNPFAAVNFKTLSGTNQAAPTETGYTELHMKSTAGGHTTPINQLDNPERAMLLMGLPTTKGDWKMTLLLGQGNEKAEIEITCITGTYAELRKNFVGVPMPGDTEVCFSQELADGRFETVLNINQPKEVLVLRYTNKLAFDLFSVSFLAKATA